jgi:GNAT superfamily N-acetyltransferase
MIEIRKIDLAQSKQKKEFVNFDYEIYKGYEHWVAPLRMDVNTRLDVKKHPFYKLASIQCFMAYIDGKAVGRIAAIQNTPFNEYHACKTGFYGFFESIDNQEVANELFESARLWLQERGLETMQGPVNPSTNYEAGLLTEGFGDPPKIMMTYNPEYYVKLHDQYGLKKAMGLLAYKFSGENAIKNEKFLRVKDLVKERSKISVRHINLKNIKQEVENIKKIYNKSWENNWGFAPMSDAEINLMADELKMGVEPGFFPFLVNEKGEDVGLALALHDFNHIFKSFNGNLFPFNFIKLFTKKKEIKWIRVVLLGILPEYRNKGLDSLLYYEIIKTAKEKGLLYAEASWILEDNPAMNRGLAVVNGEVYKKYGIYEMKV